VGTLTAVVIVVVIIVAVVMIGAWVVRRRSSAGAPPPAEPPKVSRVTDPTPMRGLEVALDQVTDRTGRNMREKIEGGTAIDDLRVPNDTGPILRRALDNVEHPHPDDSAQTRPDAGSRPIDEG
jgi:hypothetical protein